MDVERLSIGIAAAISLRRPPRRCGGFLSITLGAKQSLKRGANSQAHLTLDACRAVGRAHRMTNLLAWMKHSTRLDSRGIRSSRIGEAAIFRRLDRLREPPKPGHFARNCRPLLGLRQAPGCIEELKSNE